MERSTMFNGKTHDFNGDPHLPCGLLAGAAGDATKTGCWHPLAGEGAANFAGSRGERLW